MSRLPATPAAATATAHDPYDADRPLLLRCTCGQDHAPSDHASAATQVETLSQSFVEATLVKALFPVDSVRRGFLKAVGAGTARAAIASLLPVSALQAMAQEKGPLEKKDLKLGFIAITCATPLIMADPLGFYKKEGLNVQLNKTAGWALIRDKMINKEHDASHFLSPMPLAMSMGLGSNQVAMNVATIQNTNGQAITLHVKHKDKRDPKQWKGFKFAVPFEYSMHNFLLRYYLAENGINPDTDVQIRVTPPPEMVANLRAGNIDGFLGPDPFNQRAVYDEVGFIHLLSREIWDGHPCCAFGVSDEFIRQNPNTFAALYRAILTASFMASQPKDRELIAKVIAPTQYLNQPETVIAQVLTGKFADGLGQIRNVPERANFDPVPWQSMAVWMLTQMKRWGYSSASGIFVIFICSVWPMLLNTAFGVASVKREWLNVASTLEVRPLRKALRVILPAAAPTILTGMRISMGIAWLVIVAAEMLVGGTGIGYFVWNEWNNLSLTNVLFAILVIGVVGMLLDLAFARLQRWVTYVE